MLSVRLRSGSAVPMIGLGTWTLRGLAARRVVRTALELGYRHLDTATAYANEADVGAALADSGVDRADVFVTTKLAARHADRPRATLEASLNALQVAWVDLWLIHAPPGGRARPDVWCALLEARDAGLARAVGVSNYPVALIEELIAVTGEAPAVNQIAWGPRRHDPETLRAHRELGVVVEGYSPLINADLDDPALSQIAARHGVTPAQAVLRWHIEHGVPTIPRSARADRLAQNLDVLGFELTRAEITQIGLTPPAMRSSHQPDPDLER